MKMKRLDICKKCKYLKNESANRYGVRKRSAWYCHCPQKDDGGYPIAYHWTMHRIAYQYEKSGLLLHSRFFSAPKECPYIVEHMMLFKK